MYDVSVPTLSSCSLDNPQTLQTSCLDFICSNLNSVCEIVNNKKSSELEQELESEQNVAILTPNFDDVEMSAEEDTEDTDEENIGIYQ
jgi:hypothetical protein